MSTITTEQQAAIAKYVTEHTLSRGKGTRKSACSLAAINLGLSGRLTDDTPDCMSEVIGRWIIIVQDAMPAKMRNSAAWKSLLPQAAGTGRAKETERLAIILEWMWTVTLPSLQTLADRLGFGDAWRSMCSDRTSNAAVKAAMAARASWTAPPLPAAKAAMGAAEWASAAAEWASARASWGTLASAKSASASASAASAATRAASAKVWKNFDPCGLLAKLIDV